jgi:kynureninase
MTPSLERGYAIEQDADDALAPLRELFHLPRRSDGTPAVYLCGHSLGLQPKAVAQTMNEELSVWAERGVEGHFDVARPWVSYHEQLAPALARLAGALPHEVVAMNSLTVNLHLMLASFYRPQGQRTKLLIEKRAFSSDRYAMHSHIAQRGLDPATTLVEIEPRAGEQLFDAEDICAYIEQHAHELATIVLPGVQYLTGQCFDMERIAATARKYDCVIGLDLAHAIGNVPLKLHEWGVDFAVWCSYKYLNAGPGAIGGCFVHERYGEAFDLPRFAGWWGHDKSNRFQMPETFTPLRGAEGWQLSNPSIFAAAPLLASLELFEQAGMEALRAKSIRLSGYLELLLQGTLAADVSILTPSSIEARGCQLSLRIERPAHEARAIHEKLTRGGFVCDWREPDIVRIAPAPLYNSYADVWDFVHALREQCSQSDR